jgi:hypothetical protein
MRRFLILLLLAVLLLPAVAFAAEDSALQVKAGQSIEGDISTVDQAIIIDGTVYGDVTSIRGQIVINGDVYGDVVSWSGDVTLSEGSHVSGNVMALAGVVHREKAARITGQTFNGNLDEAGLASLIPGQGRQELSFGSKLGMALALLLLGLAVATLLGQLWGRGIDSAAMVITLFPGRTIALGLLSALLLAVVLTLVLILLTFTLIGMVAAPIVLLLAQLPFLAGLAGTGRAIERRLGLQRAQGIAGTALVLVPVFLLSLWDPFAGIVAFYVVSAAGIGALLLLRSAALRFHAA